MASALLDKSKAFALTIIKVCNEVKQTKRESVLTNQLIRSGTSVGANKKMQITILGYSPGVGLWTPRIDTYQTVCYNKYRKQVR